MVKSANPLSSRLSPFHSKNLHHSGNFASKRSAELDVIMTKEKHVNITKVTELSPERETTTKQSQIPEQSLEHEKYKKLEILLGMFNNLKGVEELRDLLEKHNTDVRREKEDGGMYPMSTNMQKRITTGTLPRDKRRVTLVQQLPTKIKNSLRKRRIPAPVESINLHNNDKETSTKVEAIFENIRGEECSNRSEEDQKNWNDAISVITMETMEERLESLVTNNEKSTSNLLFMSEQSNDIREDIGFDTRGDFHGTMAKMLYTYMTCNSNNSQGSTNFLQRNLGPGFEVVKHRSAEVVNNMKEEFGKIVNEAYDGMLDGAEYVAEVMRDKVETLFVQVKNKAGEITYDVYGETYWHIYDAKVYLFNVSKCEGEEVEEESTVFVEKWIKPTIDTIQEQDIKQSVFVMASIEQNVEVADGRGFRDLGMSIMSNENSDDEDFEMPRETNDEILMFMHKLTGFYV